MQHNLKRSPVFTAPRSSCRARSVAGTRCTGAPQGPFSTKACLQKSHSRFLGDHNWSACTVYYRRRSKGGSIASVPFAQMPGDVQTTILAGGALIDFGIQIIGWSFAVFLRTESFYDALGTVSFLALALGSLAYGGNFQWRQITMTTLVCVWTLRLGSFLLLRVLRTGGDSRFDELKHKPCRLETDNVNVTKLVVPCIVLHCTKPNNI